MGYWKIGERKGYTKMLDLEGYKKPFISFERVIRDDVKSNPRTWFGYIGYPTTLKFFYVKEMEYPSLDYEEVFKNYGWEE